MKRVMYAESGKSDDVFVAFAKRVSYMFPPQLCYFIIFGTLPIALDIV
jgi:hypothetical protein